MKQNAGIDIVQALEAYCKKKDLHLTEPRRFVYEIVANAQTPLTAYEILEALGVRIKNPKPPTVYRALDFLQQHRFIHRIESLNAFITCSENHRHNGAQFMICDSCGLVTEIHLCTIPQSLQQKATTRNFRLSYWNVELHGQCAKCADQNPSAINQD